MNAQRKVRFVHMSRSEAMRAVGVRRMLVTLLLALTAGCGQAEPESQRIFESPEAAAAAFFDALTRDDAEDLVSILGPDHRAAVVTSDWNAQHDARLEIAEAAAQRQELSENQEGVIQVILGAESWPLPISIVRHEDGWRFDTAQGIDEILNRRVGGNELVAIEIARAYVDAQIEYAREDRDGDEVLEYAQRLASTAGEKNGLYWKTGPEEEPSPLGPLVRGAERYLASKKLGDPIKGYYFSVLTRQGENAPGGAYDYVINGNMIAGFALVAYPAEYGNSGVMTFLVSHQGRVYQKDLGEFTGMEAYDPGEGWTAVEEPGPEGSRDSTSP